jgi:hypothetical protein
MAAVASRVTKRAVSVLRERGIDIMRGVAASGFRHMATVPVVGYEVEFASRLHVDRIVMKSVKDYEALRRVSKRLPRVERIVEEAEELARLAAEDQDVVLRVPPLILCESHHQPIHTQALLLSLPHLQEKGYTLFAGEHDKSRTCDELIKQYETDLPIFRREAKMKPGDNMAEHGIIKNSEAMLEVLRTLPDYKIGYQGIDADMKELRCKEVLADTDIGALTEARDVIIAHQLAEAIKKHRGGVVATIGAAHAVGVKRHLATLLGDKSGHVQFLRMVTEKDLDAEDDLIDELGVATYSAFRVYETPDDDGRTAAELIANEVEIGQRSLEFEREYPARKLERMAAEPATMHEAEAAVAMAGDSGRR